MSRQPRRGRLAPRRIAARAASSQQGLGLCLSPFHSGIAFRRISPSRVGRPERLERGRPPDREPAPAIPARIRSRLRPSVVGSMHSTSAMMAGRASFILAGSNEDVELAPPQSQRAKMVVVETAHNPVQEPYPQPGAVLRDVIDHVFELRHDFCSVHASFVRVKREEVPRRRLLPERALSSGHFGRSGRESSPLSSPALSPTSLLRSQPAVSPSSPPLRRIGPLGDLESFFGHGGACRTYGMAVSPLVC